MNEVPGHIEPTDQLMMVIKVKGVHVEFRLD